MNPLLIVLLILLFASGAGLVIFILLHSGKGTGVSEMIQSSITGSFGGQNIVEKNLNRITIILAIVFFVTLILLMFVYPQGTIVASR